MHSCCATSSVDQMPMSARMGAAPHCFGRKSPSASQPARVAPSPEGNGVAGLPPKPRATSPARVVWESPGEVSRESRRSHRACGGKPRGSMKAQTKDSSGNAVLLSVSTQVLKKYEVVALIGKGSFSQVLRIKNRTTEELYALKVIQKQPAQGNRHMTELNVLQKARHPNILTLYEVFHTNHKVYLVLGLALGGDLFDRVYSDGYFLEDPGRHIVQMVLNGTAYLHSIGITHRDLKLENVLFRTPEPDSKIVISDFGLAHMKSETGDGNPMSTMCGSAEYLAPEVLQGDEYTELIDMWALGVITYIVLSRTMPFMEDSRARLYQKIASGQFAFTDEPWSKVSLAGKDFICKLLCVDTEHRLSAQDAMEHHWFSTEQ